MASVTYVKQMMILDEAKHKSYLETFVEEPLEFEDFINFMLGSLFDDDKSVEEIIPIQDGKTFIVIYRVPVK